MRITDWWSDFIRLFAALGLIGTILIAGVAAGTQPLGLSVAVADDDDDDKDSEDGEDGEDDDGDNDDNGGGGSGNGTGGNRTGGNRTGGNANSGGAAPADDRGNGKEKDGPRDGDRGQGNDDGAPGQGQGGPVARAPEFRVVVECAALGDGQSVCMFLGLGDGSVKRLAVPRADVCADVDGISDDGDDRAPQVDLLRTATGGPSYVANDDALVLVLDAEVETNEATTYWVWADDDQLYPANGPALTCDEPAPAQVASTPASTGSIVIRVIDCGPGLAAGEEIDWYAVCAEPATGASFSIQPAAAGTPTAPRTGETNVDGELVVDDLAPGAYVVDQTNGNWCHAESDNVDDGEIIVEAGVEAAIWVFNCG